MVLVDTPASRICSQCGEAIAPDTPDLDPCLFCRVKTANLRAAQRRAKGLERRALMAELGMPPDAAWTHWTMTHHGGEFDGYRLEFFGMEVGHMPSPCPWPYLLLRAEGSRHGLAKQLWLRRVHSPGTRAFVEARWHPERGETVGVVGLEQVTSEVEGKRALRGLRLLRQYDDRGRPKGSTLLTREQFRAEVVAAYAALTDLHGHRPAQYEVAAELGISRATLTRYLADYGVPWPPVPAR